MSQKILIVEDHPLFRDALRQVVSTIVGASNVIAACSAEDGLRLIKGVPDLRLALLDIGLPGLSGSEAVTAFRSLYPASVIVIVSASDDRREVAASLRTGAQVFVSKAVATHVIEEVVRCVLAGGMPKSVWVAPSADVSSLATTLPGLTARQSKILDLLSEGYPNKEIGLRLQISEITVKQHVSSIFRRLGVFNRTQAVMTARRLGLTI